MMHVWWNSPSTGNARLVLLAIADEADDEGRNAFPSIRRLAEKTKCHTATVLRAVVKLEKSGEIEVVRPKMKAEGHGNKYRVIMTPTPTADERRARYADTPGDKSSSKMRADFSTPARNGENNRAHFASDLRAPVRAYPRTPDIDPKGFPQSLAKIPEPRPFCEKCDKWTDGEGPKELRCLCLRSVG